MTPICEQQHVGGRQARPMCASSTFPDVPKGNNKGHVDLSVMETNKETLTCWKLWPAHAGTIIVWADTNSPLLSMVRAKFGIELTLQKALICRPCSRDARHPVARYVFQVAKEEAVAHPNKRLLAINCDLASPCFLEDEVCLNNRTCVPTAGNQKETGIAQINDFT